MFNTQKPEWQGQRGQQDLKYCQFDKILSQQISLGKLNLKRFLFHLAKTILDKVISCKIH